MSESTLSIAPDISIPRTRWKMPMNHATSWNHGQLIPLEAMEVLPGDTIKLDLSALIRMSQPIAPIFGNIFAQIRAFFVPMRLLWEHTEEFYGENKSSAGPQNTVFKVPTANITTNDVSLNVSVGSVSHYLGKPLTSQSQTEVDVSVLKERAYWLIVNEWYRPEQLETPILIGKGDFTGATAISGANGALIASQGSSYKGMNSDPYVVCKQYDYFTSATIAPQYGESVKLPLGTTAPIIASPDFHDVALSSNISIGFRNKTAPNGEGLLYVNNSDDYNIHRMRLSSLPSGTTISQNLTVDQTNMIADLTSASAASIDSLIYAFAVQNYLHRASYGSRFFEMLIAQYGVTSPDARLQRPEYLGGFNFMININQVLSTAGATDDAQTKLGQPGANSVTAVRKALFTKGFVEPGYLMVLLSTKHEQSYSQGVMREDLKTDRFEFYAPAFANIGDQNIKVQEIYYDSDASDVFAYQEAWAEYRYRKNRTSGLLDPLASNSLDFWTLGSKFANAPSFNTEFIKETRDYLTRALVTGETGPDYIGDFRLDFTVTRPMPLYSVPSLRGPF